MIGQNCTKEIEVDGRLYRCCDLDGLSDKGIADISQLPYTIRILVENLLRKLDGKKVSEDALRAIANWQPHYDAPVEIPYHPARVLMQDFTGVPAVVDLACLRDAINDLGADPALVNPKVPVELVADHSVQIDHSGTHQSLTENVTREYQRNSERYTVFKWAQESFTNFKVVPPSSGICHQVNLEHLGRGMITEGIDGHDYVYPDTLVGLDSHTTMINGIGVMAWGVGGIEAEAVMLGQPYYMSIPEVVGVRLVGKPQEGITATDIVLTLTERLRQIHVVEKFVEYFGPGMQHLTIPDRASIANMTPEYGATLGFFPIDQATIEYLELTGRQEQARVTREAAKALGLFYDENREIRYSQVVEFDLATVEPSLAGPSRPQDRIPLSAIASSFYKLLGGRSPRKDVELVINGRPTRLADGSIVIAAITSCTNTSNPYLLIGAALMAKEAVKRGVQVPGHVKTSLAPGSRVVSNYLKKSGLMPYLEALGFHITAFGCTTCIGNSGPLHSDIERAIVDNELNVAAVLSGNRNFEARIHQKIQSNFLASPMLVIAFAIAGRVDIDMGREPLCLDPNGEPVYLKDLWPDRATLNRLVEGSVTRDAFVSEYAGIFDGDAFWRDLPVTRGATYSWEHTSTYIKKPPYFDAFRAEPPPMKDIRGARALLVLGDSVTTDHISPAGAIARDYPAGGYLLEQGVTQKDFNSYGSRRGNHEVMMRGTFGNIRIKNQMVGGKEGSFTIKFPENQEMFVYDAAMAYAAEATPLIVLAGKEYGTGSSRDWAAKGTNLLGVKVVIAQSFERIHRNNLVGMGVLPLVFREGDSPESLGITGSEVFTVEGLTDIRPRGTVTLTATRLDGTSLRFATTARLDTEVDVSYFLHGGILPFVLREMLKENG